MRTLSSFRSRIDKIESKIGNINPLSDEEKKLGQKLLDSFLEFTQHFYKHRTGREYIISQPISRKSHHLIISEELEEIYNGNNIRKIINCPPRYGKTELLIHFVAWTLAKHPDSQYLYISYSKDLATDQTSAIKQIVESSLYKRLFNISIRKDANAKDNFATEQGGRVCAAGSDGTIVGRGAGLEGCDQRWGGAIVMDDMHKPQEVNSETSREKVINVYINTIQTRVNSPTTPIIFIGQRLHEMDLPQRLIDGLTGELWNVTKIQGLDAAGNALNPAKHTVHQLLKMKETMKYHFSAQFQQEPTPAGDALFQRDEFQIFDKEPAILFTFLTCDTAETKETYNDATVFSFWGIYKTWSGEYALHWLDCIEIWIEPRDLKQSFVDFYMLCCRHRVKPSFAAIEKKKHWCYTSFCIKINARIVCIRD